ncbi:TM0106 family RecB-like putative nuclease [Arthrobacter sp. 35W]|uniref:TM0106 family RecB-like putative nuclease n=1 Tax=Arthrobacter sp. 35W TaxID=1132441 RepID=UPI00041BE100|nr:TM0106 family RecB-like putative nuclease [Arthrobacter sp. 35W]
MFLLEPSTPGQPADLVFSASDLVAASECEYRTLRVLDEKLGLAARAAFPADEMNRRAAELGDVHERKLLDSLLVELGPWDPANATGVLEVPRASPTRADFEAKHTDTITALRDGAGVVFQATFFAPSEPGFAFVGFADFLVRADVEVAVAPEGTAGARPENAAAYAVWDTKLARHAKVGALLQLAAYADQLLAAGIEPAPMATLVLGDMGRQSYTLRDLLPVYRERRARFIALAGGHRAAASPVEWGTEGFTACGRCDYCAGQIARTRDLLLVAGMTSGTRRKLRARNIHTIEDLAALPEAEAAGPVARLRSQARMQTGVEEADGGRTYAKNGQQHTVTYKVLPGATTATLPTPSEGDIFFDFEGDPLWQDSDGGWGLEYLFGVLEAPAGENHREDDGGNASADPAFRPFWAHSRDGERQAFLDFLAYVQERRAEHPDMHVYHYAAYEKSALRSLSQRHVGGEDIVDGWLKDGLLVDLYDTVRHSLRISESSYSIKKLEPLYMKDNLRSGDVTDAGASVVAYAQYCQAQEAGHGAEAARILASIADYNHYDCLSTLRLRDWLLALPVPGLTAAEQAARAARQDTLAGTADDAGVPAYEPSPEEVRLHEYLAALAADKHHTFSDDERAIAMIAAATGYHRRENKQFWWGHFDRLGTSVDEWTEGRNVFVVDQAQELEGWAKSGPRARTEVRTLRLKGRMSDGSDFRPGTSWFRMFNHPLPEGLEPADGGQPGSIPPRGGLFSTTVLDSAPDPANPESVVLVVQEKSSLKVQPYDQAPMALTPDQPIRTVSIQESLSELARTVGSMVPSLPKHPGVDILRRRPPRLATLDALPAVVVGDHGADNIAAITAAVRDLDHSYLAVQGPPGTGKTHVGSHVIANLVAAGWKVGVVGQAHAVVENMLTAAVEKAGIDPDRVGKKPKGTGEVAWTVTEDSRFAALLDGPDGALIGGTAWTMTGTKVPEGSLDLLVIDEAGQFSLANTLAVSRAAKRLLLLGDPQQLPQVTQGSHPEPVDESALGWLSPGHHTLPAELGYFLADSWRMHPRLCSAVSDLSYEGRLKSAPAASLRQLAGVPAGVETVFVEHSGNTISSPEEAREVVAQVRRHVGLAWTGGASADPRPLGQEDILVVAAYNAQIHRVRDALDAAGLPGVRVGTVDKFQGQEAPVVLVTMACSDIAETPRGAEFLLNRNRINVAISRGQWRAVIIRSRQLTSYMPTRPDALTDLGAFVGLCS